MSELQIWGDGVIGTAIGAAVWNLRTVLTADWSGGALHAFTVERGEHTDWGDGYIRPEGLAIRGDEALVVEQGGTLLRQDLLNPGRGGAVEVATGLGALHAVVWQDDLAHLTDLAGGRILTVDLATGAVQVAVAGLDAPVGLALGPDGDYYVTEQGSGRLTRIAPDGTRGAVVTGLVAPFLLSWAGDERTALLVTERFPAHRVGLVDLTAPVPVLERLVGRGISQPSQAVICEDRLVVTGAGRLLSLDATRLAGGVSFGVPEGPLWPGSWADVEVDCGLTGYTRAELDIWVESPDLVSISPHPAVDADPARPTIRLLAGALLGQTAVVAKDRATGEELGRAELVVGIDPGPLLDGPALWLDAATQAPVPFTLLAANRGVDDIGKLQPRDTANNVLTDWRVVCVLVDTGDATWPTTATATNPAPTVATAQTTWRDVFTGVGGLDAFFTENSNGRLGVNLLTGGVLGPVHLGGKWGDWHTMSDGQWVQKDEVVTRVVAALQGTAGLAWDAVDAVFIVMRSAGANFVWPRATIGRTLNATVKNAANKDVPVMLAKVCMPHDQTATVGFTNVEVSAHELGHTVGLDDQYMDGFPAGMQARELGRRDLMAHEDGLPHLTARHKGLLGFLDSGHVRTFTLGATETNVPVNLVPVAGTLPAAGQFTAIELRVAPRLSWFFELRQPVPGRLGDTDPLAFPAAGVVMGYDATNYALPPIVADERKPIILLIDDGDGQGALLTAGEDYESIDAVNQNDIQRFMLEVLTISPGLAQVRVNVGKVNQPDPVLVNNNGEASDFKSPSIEVRNVLSDADANWLNKPLVNETNRVVAKVTNAGGLPAPNVSVRFAVLPFNTDDPDSERWTPLPGPAATPNVTHDVAVGATIEFEVEWRPPADRHFCVQARIDRYVRVPGAAADEPDIDNNLAQSNFFTIYSKPKSPATREVSWVEVHNPLHHPIDATVQLCQDSDRYRSYVDHRWVHLDPGQTRRLRLEVESKATSIWDAIESHWPDGRTWLRTWLPVEGCASATGTGVMLGAVTAVDTSLRVLERGGGTYWLAVEGPEGAPPAPEGSVLVRVRYDEGDEEVIRGEVSGGQVRVDLQDRPGVAQAWYSGAPAYAPVDGWEFTVGD